MNHQLLKSMRISTESSRENESAFRTFAPSAFVGRKASGNGGNLKRSGSASLVNYKGSEITDRPKTLAQSAPETPLMGRTSVASEAEATEGSGTKAEAQDSFSYSLSGQLSAHGSGGRMVSSLTTPASAGTKSERLIVDPDEMEFELQVCTHPVSESATGQVCIESRGASMAYYSGSYHAFVLADSTASTLLALMDEQGRAESARLLQLERLRSALKSWTHDTWEHRVTYRYHCVKLRGEAQALEDRVLPNKTYTMVFSTLSETVRAESGLPRWLSNLRQILWRVFRSVQVTAASVHPHEAKYS
jgi:hypothetical protein